MPPGRRSGRQRGPRTVYVDDPFQTAGISDDDTPAKEPNSSKGKKRLAKKEDSPSDDEFVAASEEEVDDAIEDEEESEEQAKEKRGREEESEDGASDLEEMEIDVIETGPRKHRVSQPRQPQFKKRAADGFVVPSPDETHSRGIIDPKDHLSKDAHYTLTFGSDERDMMAAIHSRNYWTRGIDSAFPTRYVLEKRDEDDETPFGPTFGVDPEDSKKERTHGWDWYYDGKAGANFRKRQRIETIEESVARQQYLPRPDERKHRVRLGPHTRQKIFELGYHESFDLGKAWEKEKSDPKPEKARKGWILNIGHKSNCMAWAPNQNGLSQYLAVAAPLTKDQKDEYRSEDSEPFSAFQPSRPFPSALQIWEVRAKSSETNTRPLDMDYKPQLRQLICADWGDLRRMAWCTIPRDKRDEDEEEPRKPIGLLATIWGDGKVRVLDIKIGRGTQETEFRK